MYCVRFSQMSKHAHKVTEKVFKSLIMFFKIKILTGYGVLSCLFPKLYTLLGSGCSLCSWQFCSRRLKSLEEERCYNEKEAGPLMASVLIEAAPPPKLLTPREQNR